ncbi:methyltransferase domain-containing protein [Acidobacteria bacterium ACD]|nr:methyltransferase domain-containing protein [Acidobacteria bacterium ACD]
MDPGAMGPFGEALLAHLDGDAEASLVVRRDDGTQAALPASHFFRGEPDFTALERTAIELCRGRVLDAGAGAGSHSLVLQRRGHPVTAIDVSAEAVTVATRRGVRVAVRADVLTFEGGPFDTLLMLGHGIGMVETVAGLDRFLARAGRLLAADGQILLDSLDVRATDDPGNLAYHEANRAAGRYVGEVRMQFEFRGRTGPPCGWLQVDPETLRERAEAAGWRCEVVHPGERGDYLARLVTSAAGT